VANYNNMLDFVEINKSYFFKEYFDKLDKRYWTFAIALGLFFQRDGDVIVETGCVRQKDDWGAGNSTRIFGRFCKKYNFNLITVDDNWEHLEVAKKLTQEYKNNIDYEYSDSVKFLEKYDDRIDLLYLDSLDCTENPHDCNLESQTHVIRELDAAKNKLTKDSIILLDDNLFINGGKTRLAKNWLTKNDWICVMDYKQSLWIRR